MSSVGNETLTNDCSKNNIIQGITINAPIIQDKGTIVGHNCADTLSANDQYSLIIRNCRSIGTKSGNNNMGGIVGAIGREVYTLLIVL